MYEGCSDRDGCDNPGALGVYHPDVRGLGYAGGEVERRWQMS